MELLNQDEKALEWLLNWCAWYLFRPEKRLQHGILISGEGGTGKSTIAKILTMIDGGSYAPVTPKEIKDKYHDWAINNRLIIVEEVAEGKNYGFYNDIKIYFTNPDIRLNPKGFPAFTIQNNLHLMFFSNYANPMVMEGDRRFFYLHSTMPKGGKGKPFYIDLWDYLENQGGIWAFKNYLEYEIVPKLDPNFHIADHYQTKDHIELEISSRTRLAEIIQAELSKPAIARHSMFKTNKFFLFQDLKLFLDEEHPNPIFRDNAKTNAILKEQGLIREWHELDGSRQEFAWWSFSHEHLKRQWISTSKHGRAYLKTLKATYTKKEFRSDT